MVNTKLNKIEKHIEALKKKIFEIGDMRPGTLSVQYRKPSEKKVPFYQLSYTHQSKSRSEYVRSDNLTAIQSEIAAYKQFKKMTEEIIELSIQASKLRIAEAQHTDTTKRNP